MIDPARLVAHRGVMHDLPENTLPAFRAALDAGVHFLELDVQFSADGVPMVIHDDRLERITGESGSVLDRSADELAALSAHLPAQLGERHRGTPIPRLAEAMALLNRYPGITVFVEIKRQSLMRFGVEECVDAIEQVMRAADFDWVLISFIQDALEYARRRYHRPIGWVLREYNLTARRIAEIMRPEFLFCDVRSLHQPMDRLWPGSWQWVIYDIEDPRQAAELLAQGADLIESGAAHRLLETQTRSA